MGHKPRLRTKNKGWESVWKSENGVLNVTFTPLPHTNVADLLLLTSFAYIVY